MPNALQIDRSNRFCSVPQCDSRCAEGMSLVTFPKDEKLKEKWAQALKIGKPISPFMYVCSLHFIEDDFTLPGFRFKSRLRKGVIPSQNIPTRDPQPKVYSRFKNLNIKKKHIQLENIPENGERTRKNEVKKAEVKEVIRERNPNCQQLRTECFEIINEEIKNMICRGVSTQTDTMEFNKRLSVVDFIKTDKQLRNLTGISTFKLLDDITKRVELVDALTETSSENMKIPVAHRVILTFIKLKLNLSFDCIAVFFKIDVKLCKTYFQQTLQLLKASLEHEIRFPDKEDSCNRLSGDFINYQNSRFAFGYTEIPIEKSKCVNCRQRAYSRYKKTYTVKFLIGCTPSSTIFFISKSYGGRIPDEIIFTQSKILEKCMPDRDAIMVDKSFQIEAECAQYNLELIRPPCLNNNQESASESVEIVGITTAKAYIEDCIRRMKMFKILKGRLTSALLPNIYDMMIIIAAVINLNQFALNHA